MFATETNICTYTVNGSYECQPLGKMNTSTLNEYSQHNSQNEDGVKGTISRMGVAASYNCGCANASNKTDSSALRGHDAREQFSGFGYDGLKNLIKKPEKTNNKKVTHAPVEDRMGPTSKSTDLKRSTEPVKYENFSVMGYEDLKNKMFGNKTDKDGKKKVTHAPVEDFLGQLPGKRRNMINNTSSVKDENFSSRQSQYVRGRRT